MAILALLTCGAVTPTSAADVVPATDTAAAANAVPTTDTGDASDVAAAADTAAASDAPESFREPVDVEVYQGPSFRTFPRLDYPDRQRELGKEGWVQLNFMVDPNGNAYEISVVDSIGGAPFEQNAIRAVRNARFRPARQGSTPVHAGFDMMLRYVTNPRRGAKPEFVRAYEALVSSIERDDRAAADEQLPKLEVSSIYEHVYKHLALYHYHRKWGTERQQYSDLQAALARAAPDPGSDRPRYIDKKTYVSSLNSLLTLALKLNDLGRALSIWEDIQKLAPKEQVAAWRPTMDQVSRLRESGPPVHFEAEIEKGNSWFDRLFRKNFEVVVLSGRVSEIKLRCEKKFIFFHYEPNVRYTVESQAGNCWVQVVGENGTKFGFVQL